MCASGVCKILCHLLAAEIARVIWVFIDLMMASACPVNQVVTVDHMKVLHVIYAEKENILHPVKALHALYAVKENILLLSLHGKSLFVRIVPIIHIQLLAVLKWKTVLAMLGTVLATIVVKHALLENTSQQQAPSIVQNALYLQVLIRLHQFQVWIAYLVKWVCIGKTPVVSFVQQVSSLRM